MENKKTNAKNYYQCSKEKLQKDRKRNFPNTNSGGYSKCGKLASYYKNR